MLHFTFRIPNHQSQVRIREFKSPKDLIAHPVQTLHFIEELQAQEDQLSCPVRRRVGMIWKPGLSHLPSQLCELMLQPSPERGQFGRKRKERTQSVPPGTVHHGWMLPPKEVTWESRRRKVSSQESYAWNTKDTPRK